MHFTPPLRRCRAENSYRWSGITAKRLEGVTTRLVDVQEKLSELFDYNTILAGHSLDCDLRVLKVRCSVPDYVYQLAERKRSSLIVSLPRVSQIRLRLTVHSLGCRYLCRLPSHSRTTLQTLAQMALPTMAEARHPDAERTRRRSRRSRFGRRRSSRRRSHQAQARERYVLSFISSSSSLR